MIENKGKRDRGTPIFKHKTSKSQTYVKRLPTSGLGYIPYLDCN